MLKWHVYSYESPHNEQPLELLGVFETKNESTKFIVLLGDLEHLGAWEHEEGVDKSQAKEKGA